MKTQFFQTEFKAIPLEGSKTKEVAPEIKTGTIIKGYASTPTKDRYGDVVEPEAFRKSIQSTYKNNPIILFQHDANRPIGKATFMAITEKGLYIEAVVSDEEVEPKVQAGILKTFSIGFIPLSIEFRDEDGRLLDLTNTEDRAKIWNETTTRIIKEVDLIENSIVSTPANPDALVTLEKSIKSFFEKNKECIEGMCGIENNNRFRVHF